MQVLIPNVVPIWLTHVDDVSDDHLDGLAYLLSPEERERQSRFVFAEDRRLFLIARAHIRTVLSLYAPVHPREWYFRVTAYGRPYIDNEAVGDSLHFSLSHTQGLVASAVSLTREVGIDAEKLTRNINCLELAEAVCTPEEVSLLRTLSGDDQRRHFLQLWTLKEAYAKARGLGLSLDFTAVAFRLECGRVCAQSSSSLCENLDEWKFELFQPTRIHQIAIAFKSGRELTARAVTRSLHL